LRSSLYDSFPNVMTNDIVTNKDKNRIICKIVHIICIGRFY